MGRCWNAERRNFSGHENHPIRISRGEIRVDMLSSDQIVKWSKSHRRPAHRYIVNPNHLLRIVRLLGAVLCLSGGIAQAEDADALIAKGDQFDKKFQPKEALEEYLPANKLEPNNVRLLVCIARQYRHLMSETSSKQEKLRLGNVSLEFAGRAATLAPDNAEAQLSPAISYGKMLPFMGSKDQVNASPRIKAAVDRTLQLDPANDIAWHMLGRWNRVLANINVLKRVLAKALYGELPVTTNEAAEKCLLKAIAINPNRLMHYIELGRIYAQMGRKEEARKNLQKGLTMPNKDHDDPETKEVGQQTLEKL
jgi:tetratricopeptide (TPR) repeat protein